MFSNDDDDDYHSAAAACVCCTCLLIRSKDDIIKLLCKQTSSPFLPHPSVAHSLPCTTYSDWSFVSQSQPQDALLLPSLLPSTSPPHAVSVRFPWTPSHLVLVVPPCISASWSIIAVCVGSASGKFIALLFFFTGERVIGGSLKPYIIRKYPDISLETSESQPHIVVGCGRPVAVPPPGLSDAIKQDKSLWDPILPLPITVASVYMFTLWRGVRGLSMFSAQYVGSTQTTGNICCWCLFLWQGVINHSHHVQGKITFLAISPILLKLFWYQLMSLLMSVILVIIIFTLTGPCLFFLQRCLLFYILCFFYCLLIVANEAISLC